MAASLVLLSAGLDSAVNLKCALDSGRVAAAITFDYGQRAARRERECAALMCRRFNVRHEIIRLPWLGRITRGPLVARNRAMPRPRPRDLDDRRASIRRAERVWTPNRNGVFLALGAAWAEALRVETVVAGFNAEEAASFPDNSTEFVQAFNKSLRFSTRTRVRVKSHTARRRKPSIVRLGVQIGAPLDLVWCCYEGGRRLCGKCESCLRFLRAVREAGQYDWFERNHARMPRAHPSRRNH